VKRELLSLRNLTRKRGQLSFLLSKNRDKILKGEKVEQKIRKELKMKSIKVKADKSNWITF
jgi:hypothetical protein